MKRLLRPARWLEPRRVGVVACLAVALAAGTVLGQLGGVLAGMHVPGAGSYTITDLTDTRFGIPKAENSADVIRTWREAQIPDGFRGPGWNVYAFALVDFLFFAPAYALLLAIALLKLRGSVEANTTPERLNQLASARMFRRGEGDEESFAAEHRGITSVRDAVLRLIGATLAAVPLLFLLDELENVLIPLVYEETPNGSRFGLLFFFLGWAALLKWALGVLVVIGLVVATIAAASVARGRMAKLWTALVVLRPQLLLLAFFAAGLFASDQSGDVILRWRDDPIDGLAAVALTGAFAVVALVSARLLLGELGEDDRVVPEAAVFWLGIALLVAGAVGEYKWQFGEGLAVLGGIFVLAIALSGFAGETMHPRRLREVGRFALALPALLGGLPLVLLGLAALRTSVPEVAYARKSGFLLLAVLALGLQAIGWAVALRWNRKASDRRLKLVLWVALAFSVLLALRVYLNPWRTSEGLGSIGVFAGFTVGATLLAFVLVFLAERYRAPTAFAVLRLKRTPVFLLLALWALVAAKLDQNGAYYDVRTAPASQQAQDLSRQQIAFDRVDPDRRDAFDEWVARRPTGGAAVPLVFVSAAGGGIRAGYWVAAVLDCVLEGRGDDDACRRHGDAATERASGSVFAASGISGGSVGLAAYATHLRYKPEEDWRDDRLGDDYVAPLIGWSLFVDVPMALIRRDGGMDRAEVIERAFERSWVEDIADRGASGVLWKRGVDTDGTPMAIGIFDLWARAQRREDVPLPLLLLNGTKVQDGCRFNGSVFDAAVEYVPRKDSSAAAARLAEDCLALRLFERTPPGEEQIYVKPESRADWTFASTEDLSDFVCSERDVRLSTVAMLSSRFPFALPSGRLEKCRTRNAPAINVVDGGYFDTSGASPLVELWSELEPEVDALNAQSGRACIVPLFLQIDTGYSDPTSGKRGRPFELNVPLQTAKAARNAREANARQASALAFSGPFGRVQQATLANGAALDRYAHIYPRAHPGSKAPLGWTLSRTAREDLDRQLSANTAEIEKVRDWFNGSLRCQD